MEKFVAAPLTTQNVFLQNFQTKDGAEDETSGYPQVHGNQAQDAFAVFCFSFPVTTINRLDSFVRGRVDGFSRIISKKSPLNKLSHRVTTCCLNVLTFALPGNSPLDLP